MSENCSYGVAADLDTGREWIGSRLADSGGIGPLLLDRLTRSTSVRLLAPASHEAAVTMLDDASRSIPVAETVNVFTRAAAAWAHLGARTVIVQDDLGRRGDAGVDGDSVYLGDRLLRWHALDDLTGAGELLRTGSSWYPLTAVVTTADWNGRVTHGADIPNELLAESLAGAMAILTSVFDAEAIIAALLEPTSGQQRA